MKPRSILAALVLAFTTSAIETAAQTPPPAPALIEPANGAALVQPMTLRWSAVVDPDGPIGSYTWQVGTTSTFTVVMASGFTESRTGEPAPTQDRVSGLPNGTFFWRVKATQIVGGATGAIDSAWSAVRSVTVTGLGPAPGSPTITGPTNGSRFHAREAFTITWSSVPGAHYYMLEADDESSFSHPFTLTTTPMEFGTSFRANWGNEIPNIYYRVRAVSEDNVRGLPSPVVNVQITNAAPVPPAPTPLSPVGGATVSLPFTFDWSDTANPQIPAYDIDVDDEPNFEGALGVLLVQDISRSDYTLVSDTVPPLAPGTYFWRVRALHGAVFGPWSAGASFRVVASPPTPPGLDLFWVITEPGSEYGGRSTQARVTLTAPAPPGGAVVRIASDMPHAEVPESVFIPEGATDATAFPVTTVPVRGATIGRLRGAYGNGWQQSSLGLFPLLFSLSLNTDTIVGGNPVTGTVTLQRPAPAGGIQVTLVSSDTALVRPPARVLVPEGATAASFAITTAAVAGRTQVIVNTGTANDGYRAPEAWLTLLPAGSPTPAPVLASVSLRSTSVLAGGTTTGTITLTGPAPAGGAAVWVNGSMEGQVVTPAGGVTVPAGSQSADFTITAPQVNATNWVLIQASYLSNGGMHAALLRIDPDPPAIPNLLAIGTNPNSVIGGTSTRGTVGLVTAAPAGGTTVFLSSNDPSLAQVPASVNIAAGNSANSFTITTNSVTNQQSVQISATSGDVTKTTFLTLTADPNAPVVLNSVTPSVSGTTGGNNISATLFLTGAAPAGGAVVTLSSSNPAAAQVPASVTVPAGQGFASFTITTSPVAAETSVTITGTYGVSRSAIITVLAGPSNTGFMSPGANAADSGGDGNGFETGPANAHGDDAASAVDTNSGTASSTSCTSTARDKHRFFNYGIALPAGSIIQGIEVRLDARVDGTGGSPRMCVELSWDGGVSWTAAQATPTLSTTMTTRILGGPANAWGRSWTAAEFSNANFRVRVTNVASSTARDFSLDWIAVRITHQGGDSAPDTTPPTVSITSPSAGATVSGTTTISATASDNVAVTRVEFLVDGVLLSTDTTAPYSASWDTTTATNASHSLTARAFDAANNQATSGAVSVTVNNAPTADTTPPTVSITSPAAGATVSGTVTISAGASDNVGVTRVEFLVDGVLLSTDTTSPYSASWNTTTATNGAHSLTARAFDAANNQTTSASVSATVNNGAPPALDITLSGVPATIRRGQTFTATGTVTNTGGSSASGYSVVISFTPGDSMRLENPQNATQSVAAVPAGGSQNVSWQIRADRAATATLTMTLRNSAGATVDTVTQTITITD